jgi:hypothetical protein
MFRMFRLLLLLLPLRPPPVSLLLPLLPSVLLLRVRQLLHLPVPLHL